MPSSEQKESVLQSAKETSKSEVKNALMILEKIIRVDVRKMERTWSKIHLGSDSRGREAT